MIFFKNLLAVFFIGDSEDDNFAGDDAIVHPEFAASQSVKGWLKAGQFLDSCFAERQRGRLQI